MRIESQIFPQTLVESSKPLEKKDVTSKSFGENPTKDESPGVASSSFVSSGTYSVSSLKAAVDYHVKFLSVAENNMRAIQHPPTIPKMLLDHFNGLQEKAIE